MSSIQEGPLLKPDQHVWTHAAENGVPFTDGVEVLVLTGDEEATIDSIELVGDKAIELVGTKLVAPGRKWGSIQRMPWPPRDPGLSKGLMTEAENASILPRSQVAGQGYELLIGMRVTEPGYHVREGVRVNYEVGGEAFSQYLPAVLAICSHAGSAPKKCPEPKNWNKLLESIPQS